jgi:hypothetical protein
LTPSPKIGIESNFDHGIEFASNLEGPGWPNQHGFVTW